jgi:hypothetical protein
MDGRDPAADERAKQFLRLWGRGASSKEICAEMGWTSKYPSQRVHVQMKRLRDRGYTIPPRGLA